MSMRKGKVYLTLKKETTLKFRRDDLIGKKNFIKCEFIKVTKVPQYKLLNFKNILDFASAHIAINQYLLEYDYHKELNKECLDNIVNSKFKRIVLISLKKLPKKALIASQNLVITVRPEFMRILKISQSISTWIGKSIFLVRLTRPKKDQTKI